MALFHTTKNLEPFSISYSPGIHELLVELNCSIGISTYQAGKVVFISPHQSNETLITLNRTFRKPMGMFVKGDKMAICLKDEVVVLKNSKELASKFNHELGTYDSLWLPRTTYYTGCVDMHDIAFGDNDEIYAINTLFSCVCKIDSEYNFTPIWKPPFIKEVVHGDLCHMNGMVILNGKPKYITALGTSTIPKGWKENIIDGGILMDIETDETILSGLSMPHSPKMYKDELYMLMSASGEFIKVDVNNKSYTTLKKFDGFCRGLSFCGDYAFIGFSKLRKDSSTFSKLPFSDKGNFSGIKIVHVPTNEVVGEIMFETSIDEIYEVMVLEDTVMPNILNTREETHKDSLITPGITYWRKKAKKSIKYTKH